MDDADELDHREHEYVARALGITIDLLDCHPYRMDEEHCSGTTWRVLWSDAPPDEVEVRGEPGALWTDIPSLFNTGGIDAQGA